MSLVNNGGTIFSRGASGGGGGSGTVTSVSGVNTNGFSFSIANPTTTPAITLSFVGNTSLVTVGTITTGVWQGTAVAAGFGGTGQTTYSAKGDLLVSSGTTTLSKLTVGANGTVLTADSTQTTGVKWAAVSGSSSANPSATIGLAAVNGSAGTFMTSDSAPALSQAIVPTWTGLHSFVQTGLTTTLTPGIALQNTTASLVGTTVQNSPAARFTGHAWNTTATAADNYIDVINYLVPVSGATTSGKLIWSFSTSTTSTPSYSEFMSINSTAVNNNAGPALQLNRAAAGANYGFTAGNGNIYFFAGSTSAGFGMSSGGTFTTFAGNIVANGNCTPGADNNTYLCGTSVLRWLKGFFGPGGITIGGGGSPSATAGTVASGSLIVKPVASIADTSATAVVTITVPNAAHSATVRVTLCGSLGAGGAIGANEATGNISYDFAITRTAGANAAGLISTGFGASTASVVGGSVMTITAVLSAVSGAVGASNTFTVNVTITAITPGATNHTCLVRAEVINANATGITVS